MEWISVKDRLPEENKRVLFVDKESWITTGFFTGMAFEYSHGEEIGLELTHWMPLPEPPKI